MTDDPYETPNTTLSPKGAQVYNRRFTYFSRVVLVLASIYHLLEALSYLSVVVEFNLWPENGAVSMIHFAILLQISYSVASIAMAVLFFLQWEWSLWVFAISIAALTALGYALGLDIEVFAWEKIFPWVMLALSAFWEPKFFHPWKVVPDGK